MRSLRLLLAAPFASVALLATNAYAMQAGGTVATPQLQTGKSPARKPTAEEIDDAKTKGLVWANRKTHVYHKLGSSSYGTTKHGAFMTEDQATHAGYRAAKESGQNKAGAIQTSK